MNNLLFQESDPIITYKSEKTGRIYVCRKLGVVEFHKKYKETNLDYLPDPSTKDDIWFLERTGIGPVSHLSYCLSMNCIMTISTDKRYEKEGLATFLIQLALNHYYPEVNISAFTRQGELYIRDKVAQVAKKIKTKVIEYRVTEDKFITYS